MCEEGACYVAITRRVA